MSQEVRDLLHELVDLGNGLRMLAPGECGGSGLASSRPPDRLGELSNAGSLLSLLIRCRSSQMGGVGGGWGGWGGLGGLNSRIANSNKTQAPNKRKRHDTKSTCEGFHTKPLYGRFCDGKKMRAN